MLGVAHGHGQDGRVPHLRDERGARVQLGRAVALAATGSLGHDAHDLVVLQHARCTLDGGAVGRVALDGKRAHARQHLAHQTVRVAERTGSSTGTLLVVHKVSNGFRGARAGIAGGSAAYFGTQASTSGRGSGAGGSRSVGSFPCS